MKPIFSKIRVLGTAALALFLTRFYEWRSKLLRKGGFIPVKVNSKGPVSYTHLRCECLCFLSLAKIHKIMLFNTFASKKFVFL